MQADILAKVPPLPSGSPAHLFLTLAHHPALLQRFNVLAGLFYVRSALSPYEREATTLRVAARVNCPYEIYQHIPIASQVGLSGDITEAILDSNTDLATFPHELGQLLAFVDAVLEGTVNDDLWGQQALQRGPDQILELICLIGFYRLTADVLNNVRVEIDHELLPNEGN
jgi:alkylhydroperoxidase family enzyme